MRNARIRKLLGSDDVTAHFEATRSTTKGYTVTEALRHAFKHAPLHPPTKLPGNGREEGLALVFKSSVRFQLRSVDG